VLVSGNGSTPLTGVRVHSKAGQALVKTDGDVTDRIGFSAH
jgi:hypothetical protein